MKNRSVEIWFFDQYETLLFFEYLTIKCLVSENYSTNCTFLFIHNYSFIISNYLILIYYFLLIILLIKFRNLNDRWKNQNQDIVLRGWSCLIFMKTQRQSECTKLLRDVNKIYFRSNPHFLKFSRFFDFFQRFFFRI
jgi:hypothetical protein